jgi:signal transduction histidine kinase
MSETSAQAEPGPAEDAANGRGREEPGSGSDDHERVGLPPHFLSRLAHDIRSPLGLLSGALEEIRADLEGPLDEGHERMLALADRGLARLDRMARTLSTVAQLEGRTLRLQRESVDLGRLAREVVETVEREDPRRGLTIELDLADGTFASVDVERMREALWELVAQSRRQAATTIHVSLDEESETQLELRVEDDGRGFDGAQKRYAFDRLYEPADRRGTGLGLSVARDLVRAHGGDVVLADSRLAPGRPGTLGSCFVLTLPR